MVSIKKEDVKKALSNLKKLRGKMEEVAGIVKKDAIYGTQIGKLTLKILSLQREKLNQLREIGKTTYNLCKRGKITDSTLSKQCDKLKNIEKNIKQSKTEVSKLKKKFVKK